MWDEVLRMLHAKGGQLTNDKCDHKKSENGEVASARVLVYKASNCGSATLPVEVNGVKTLAILDTISGISIATKNFWE